MARTRIALLLSTFALTASAVPVRAQGLIVKAGAGAAIPVGGVGETRDAGPAAMVSVEARLSQHWGLRLDGEWSRLKARPAPAGKEAYSQYADLRTRGLSLNGVLAFPEAKVTPYLLLGIGKYRLQEIGQSPSPYGTTGALQAGFGFDSNFWERLNAFVEGRYLLHLTDYGSSEYSFTVYLPVILGVRIR